MTAMDEIVRQYLIDPENTYLVNHYRCGDTGVIGWVAGAIISERRMKGEPRILLNDMKRIVKAALDREVKRCA